MTASMQFLAYRVTLAREVKFAKSLYGDLPEPALHALKELITTHQFSSQTGISVLLAVQGRVSSMELY